MADELFDNLNLNQSLNYFKGNSEDELLEFIKSVRLPLKIISIYSVGTKHVAWFQTSAKIVRKKKEI